MRITIENTDKIVNLETQSGVVPARVWEGQTESGIPLHCYITRVAVAVEHDFSQFERELIPTKAPSEAVGAIPDRLSLGVAPVTAMVAGDAIPAESVRSVSGESDNLVRGFLALATALGRIRDRAERIMRGEVQTQAYGACEYAQEVIDKAFETTGVEVVRGFVAGEDHGRVDFAERQIAPDDRTAYVVIFPGFGDLRGDAGKDGSPT